MTIIIVPANIQTLNQVQGDGELEIIGKRINLWNGKPHCHKIASGDGFL